MNNNLGQIIQNHFNQDKIKSDLEDLARRYFSSDGQRKAFLKLIELIKQGDFDIDDVAYYANEWLGIDFNRALEMDKELFDKVFGDVYDELQQFYKEKQEEKLEEIKKQETEKPADEKEGSVMGREVVNRVSEENAPSQSRGDTPQSGGQMEQVSEKDTVNKDKEAINRVFTENRQKAESPAATSPAKPDLAAVYQHFTQSSFFQNAKQAQQTISERVAGNQQRLKDLFYQSINAGDKVKVVGILRVIFSSGVRKFFSSDKRYFDFMSKFLSQKHKSSVDPAASALAGGNNQRRGAAGRTFNRLSASEDVSGRTKADDQDDLSKFITDPANKKYVVLFIRLILEKKLKFGQDDSAMIGVGLGSLAREAGESEYEDVAYGDEEKNRFVWADI